MPLEDIIAIIAAEFSDKDVDFQTLQLNAEKLYKKYKSDNEVLERLRKICEQMI